MTTPNEKFKPSFHILPSNIKNFSSASNITAPSLTYSSKSKHTIHNFISLNAPTHKLHSNQTPKQRISENALNGSPGTGLTSPPYHPKKCKFLEYSEGIHVDSDPDLERKLKLSGDLGKEEEIENGKEYGSKRKDIGGMMLLSQGDNLGRFWSYF
jgi:hypothetical protein